MEQNVVSVIKKHYYNSSLKFVTTAKQFLKLELVEMVKILLLTYSLKIKKKRPNILVLILKTVVGWLIMVKTFTPSKEVVLTMMKM